jgi:hypothetical protein
MNGLTLDTFITSDTDREKNQYKVLGALRWYSNDLNKKKIYPALGELINLAGILEQILEQKSSLNFSFPKEIKEYDLKNKKLIFQSIEKSDPNVEILFELIEWALPKIKEVIDEGIVLYDFVDKSLKIEGVGLLPIYKDEGYFIIPDNLNQKFQVHRFEFSLFASETEKYRSLKTNLLEVINTVIEKTPEAIKLDLIKNYNDLPNPATFFCGTELDFPFDETIFPIAKRKLMLSVASS